MTDHIEAKCMVNFLNDLFERDPQFMTCLSAVRFPCNAAVAMHPTVQVRASKGAIENDDLYETGLVGVLNGYFARNYIGKPEHYIAGVLDEEGVLVGFELVQP